METLQIGQVALQTGISIDAIRFYEKAGVLPRPARSKSGYRLYQQSAVEDLDFVRKAQELGFSLGEIRQLFAIQRHPQEACVHVRDLVEQKLTVVRSKISELRELEAGLAAALKRCQQKLRHSPKHLTTCPVLQDIRSVRARRRPA